jgi:hypothetical protein
MPVKALKVHPEVPARLDGLIRSGEVGYGEGGCPESAERRCAAPARVEHGEASTAGGMKSIGDAACKSAGP